MRRGRSLLRGSAAAFLLTAAPALAESVAQEQATLLRARADADAALDRAARFDRRAKAARSAAERAAAERAAVTARIASGEADIRAAEARVALVEAARRRQARRLADARAPVARLTAALQTLARRPPALALVQPGSIADLVHVRMLLAASLPAIRARSAGLAEELVRAEQLDAAARLAARTLAHGRTRLEQRRAELARLEGGQRLASQRFADLGMEEQDRAATLGEKARDLVDQLEEEGRESEVRARLGDLAGPFPRPDLPVLPPGIDPVPANAPAYRLPARGRLVTGLGELFESGVRSKGLTFATGDAAEVLAPAAGRVLFAGPFRRYGTIVILDHGGGWTTLIAGLAATGVAAGGSVAEGDAIGHASSSAPRVTVELRRQNQPLDLTRLLSPATKPL